MSGKRCAANAARCTLHAVRFTFLAALVINPATLPAQAGPGSEGPIVLQSSSSVRSAGLHGAGAALVGDASAVFHNPAGLATIRHVALEAGYFSAPFDAAQTSAAFALRLGQFNFGAGIKYFDFGTEPEVVPDAASGGVLGTETGATINAHEFLGVGSLIYRFGLIAFGGSVKVLRQSVANVQQQGLSGDVGLAIAVFDIMALGFSVQNLRGNWDGGSSIVMPRLTRLGFTMNYVDPQETFRLMSTLEGQWPDGRGARVVFGVEGGIVVRGVGVIGRTGVGSRTQGSDQSAFSYGLSLNVARLTVDYGYEPFDLLGDASQRIGVRLTL